MPSTEFSTLLAEQLADTSTKLRSTGKSRELDERLKDGAVGIAEMPNFVGDGVADDILPARAAVALAFTEKKSVVIPDGCKFKISDSLFTGDLDNPTFSGFSVGLFGMGRNLGNDNNCGSQIVTTFNDKPAIIIGAGQGMSAGNFTVMGPSGQYRAEQHADGIGVALLAASGGSRALVENVGVVNFHTAIKTGYGDGSLCDSLTLRKCWVENAAIGVHYSGTQNFIQHISDCGISAQIAIFNGLGLNVEVESTNLSATSGRVGIFAITDVSALTDTASGNSFVYSFTATVTDPDSNLEVVDGDGVPLLLRHGEIFLDGFGVVPVVVSAYDVNTQVISLYILPIWGYFHYGNHNAKSVTDIEAELQAATVLCLAEIVTTFIGGGFNASSIHVENPTAVSQLIDTAQGFDSGTARSYIRQLYCNSSPDSPVGNSPEETLAKRRIQSGHPFIRISNTGLTLESCELANDTDGVNVDFVSNALFKIIDPLFAKPPNVRAFLGARNRIDIEQLGASGSGAGEWSTSPFFPPTGASSVDKAYRTTGISRGPYRGWYPSNDTHPRLTTAQLSTLQGALPGFTTNASPSYPCLFGGTIYSVLSDDSGPLTDHFARSAHKGGSWGQNLTTTNITNLAWSYKGKSHVIFVNAEFFERAIPGFVYLFNNGGGDQEVILTGMSVREGYITVMPWGGELLNGTKTVTYNGTAVGQQPYDIETF